MMNFSDRQKWSRPVDALVADTDTSNNGASVDMQNFEGVTFIALLGDGDTNADVSIKAQQSDDNGVGDDWTDLAGTSIAAIDTDDDGLLILEVYRPRKRFVRPVIVRANGTLGFAVDGIIAAQSGARKLPVTQPADVVGHEIHASPAEGTA